MSLSEIPSYSLDISSYLNDLDDLRKMLEVNTSGLIAYLNDSFGDTPYTREIKKLMWMKDEKRFIMRSYYSAHLKMDIENEVRKTFRYWRHRRETSIEVRMIKLDWIYRTCKNSHSPGLAGLIEVFERA